MKITGDGPYNKDAERFMTEDELREYDLLYQRWVYSDCDSEHERELEREMSKFADRVMKSGERDG